MIRSYHLHTLLTVLVTMFLWSQTVFGATTGGDPECGDPTAWSGFTHVLLQQSIDGAPETTEWDASLDYATKDILVHTNTPANGSIAMVEGRIMLSKGLDLQPGYEIDAIDAPVLSMKLVMILLGRVFPGGPAEVSGQQQVEHTDQVGIKFATPSASGYIAAPWTVTGDVWKQGAGKVSFDLVLNFPQRSGEKGNGSIEMKMTGALGMLDHPVFLDSDSLDGWRTYGVGPRQIEQPTATIVDYGTTPGNDGGFDTIGDVRALIAAQYDPGFADPTKDFTGFWKEECDQAFGLQIMHQGNDGKYSIVFCGPGGCGDPSQGRLTFISGDKRFEVVSEDELIEVERSGDRSRYYRCTREAHPVLRYRK